MIEPSNVAEPGTPAAAEAGEALADAVAIIGLSCRFPDAPTPDDFWENLRNGVESVRSFTADDLRAVGLDPALMSLPNYVNSGVVLDGADTFDAAFFGLNPRDAEILDPQQRIFLECAWSALEDAGYDPASCDGPIGVYAGSDMSSYLFNVYANPEIVASVGPFAISLANDKDHVTTRVAYKLNLKGPAVTVQTTCSTSLVAICQAAQSLLYFQCDLALAGEPPLLSPKASATCTRRAESPLRTVTAARSMRRRWGRSAGVAPGSWCSSDTRTRSRTMTTSAPSSADLP